MKNKKIIIPIVAFIVIALGVGGFFAVKQFSNSDSSMIGEILGTPQNAELVKVVVSSDIDMNPNAIHVEITDAENLAKFSEMLKYEAEFAEEKQVDGTGLNVSFHFADGSVSGFMPAEKSFRVGFKFYDLVNDKLDIDYIESFFAKN